MTAVVPAAEDGKVEIVIVEDDNRTLRSLVKFLSAFPDLLILGTAATGSEAVDTIRALQPKLVLLDLELPGMDGLKVTEEVKRTHPQIEILILTSFDDEQKVFLAMQAGASGYLVKRVAPEQIHAGILEVLAGGSVIEAKLAKRFWNYFQSVQGHSDEAVCPLDATERDVLQMIGRGLTNQETGQVLKLEYRTVRTLLGHIYTKLTTHSRSEAVVIALKKGWITL